MTVDRKEETGKDNGELRSSLVNTENNTAVSVDQFVSHNARLTSYASNYTEVISI